MAGKVFNPLKRFYVKQLSLLLIVHANELHVLK